MYYICVDSSFTPPTDAKYKYHQLTKPNFLKFVQPIFDRSRKRVTEPYMMRQIVEKIAMEAYSDELYRPNPAYVNYEGLSFTSPEELEAIIARIVDKYCPNAFFYFLSEKIRQIPTDTEIVFFYGTYAESDALLKRGLKFLGAEESKKYIYVGKDEEETTEPPIPESLPTDRLPSNHEYKVEDQAKKAKRKIKGEFKDGTQYNSDMLVGADTSPN